MLIAHPLSRPVMGYAFQADNVTPVVSRNLLSNEPFEFFPPAAGDMSSNRRYLAAFRIVRRILSGRVKPDTRDLQITERFIGGSAELESDNAYWPQLMAAMQGHVGNEAAGLAYWNEAMSRGRWETGETEALQMLWREIQAAEGIRLAWQGMFALDYSSHGPGNFIAGNINNFAFKNIEARYATLLNASVILDSARSFATANAAIRMAERAVFGREDPISALGQRRFEEVKSLFPRQVAQEMSEAAGDHAAEKLQTLESWQTFYRSGTPLAASTAARVRVESLLSASLPSSLLMSALVLLTIGLCGIILSSALGSVLNPDRRVVILIGVIIAVFVYVRTGAWLLGLWALTIAAVLAIPQMVARDASIEWRKSERFAVGAIALFGLFLLTSYFLLDSTPAKHLIGSQGNASAFGIIAFLTLSFSIPAAAVWARIRKVSLLRAIGETLKLLGLLGAFLGLAITLVSTPLALWRDAQNRELLASWIRNEPATFRPDASP